MFPSGIYYIERKSFLFWHKHSVLNGGGGHIWSETVRFNTEDEALEKIAELAQRDINDQKNKNKSKNHKPVTLSINDIKEKMPEKFI